MALLRRRKEQKTKLVLNPVSCNNGNNLQDLIITKVENVTILLVCMDDINHLCVVMFFSHKYLVVTVHWEHGKYKEMKMAIRDFAFKYYHRTHFLGVSGCYKFTLNIWLTIRTACSSSLLYSQRFGCCTLRLSSAVLSNLHRNLKQNLVEWPRIYHTSF